MRPYVDTDSPVVKVMREAGFERLLDVSAVPGDGRGRVRYSLRTPVLPTENWYLRSFGTRFDLVLPGWPGRWGSRWYSLGWGMVDGRQTADLLLAQVVDLMPRVREARATAEELLRPLCGTYAADVGTFRQSPCLRIAAVLDHPREGHA